LLYRPAGQLCANLAEDAVQRERTAAAFAKGLAWRLVGRGHYILATALKHRINKGCGA